MIIPFADRVSSLMSRAQQRIENFSHEWIMFVAWTDLLLASWPVAPEQLRRFVPAGVELDTFDGSAWVSIVPFNAVDMHFRGLPPIPGQGAFGELNFRTYVKMGAQKGVLFLSLDCRGRVAQLIGTHLFHLPFKDADIDIGRNADSYHVKSVRRVEHGPAATFIATYQPSGEPATPAAGTIEEFLTHRLSLFVPGPDGTVHRGDIEHAPWMVQPVTVSIDTNTIGDALGITLAATPGHAAFAARTDSLVYPLVRQPTL